MTDLVDWLERSETRAKLLQVLGFVITQPNLLLVVIYLDTQENWYNLGLL